MLNGLLHGIYSGSHKGTESYGIGMLIAGSLKNGFLGNILTQVCDTEAMALYHNFDDVLANIMDVALDGGYY